MTTFLLPQSGADGGGYKNMGQSYDPTQYTASAAPAEWGLQYRNLMILSPIPPPAAAAPSPTLAPFRQFTSNTAGSTIMIAYGNCRLPGSVICSTGIEATSDGSSSYVTLQLAYCEPADPTEPLRIERMWADSTQFYDVNSGLPGNVLTVANLTAADQQALLDSVNSMEIHWGGPGEQPSDIFMAILGGADYVPAYVGLRTVVLPNFPLAISNNAQANITVEFRRTDTTLVDVSVAMQKVLGCVLKRRGVDPASVQVEGIDDQCYGVIASAQGQTLDFVTRHKQIYRYQILDGDPIRIVRREVNSGLVIDFDIDERDLEKQQGAPTIQFARTKPEDMPIGIDLSFPDIDRGYDMKPASALHEGTAGSTLISSLTSDFITDGATARALAFEVLYTTRSQGMRVAKEMRDTRVQPGDVIRVTTREGDQYIMLAEQQTHTKARTARVSSTNLLTASGIEVGDDSGSSGGSVTRLNWPADVMLADFLVTSSRIYTAAEFPITAALNSYPSPPLKIASSKFKYLDEADQSFANWGNANFPVNMFEDDTYVYWFDYRLLCFSRLAKSSTTITPIQTWVVPAGFIDENLTPDDTNENSNGNFGFAFRNGKLYIPWSGGFNGSLFASNNDIKLVVVDMTMWGDQTSAAWEIHDVYTWSSGDTPYFSMGCVVLDNGLVVVIGTNTFLGGTKFWSSDVLDLTTWSVDFGTVRKKTDEVLISHGNVIYGVEDSGNTGVAYEKHRCMLWDFSGGGFSESIVDMTDDANVVAISQLRGWSWKSDTHFFVFCNHTNYSVADMPVRAPRRYVARRKLSDGSADGGAFVDEIMWNGYDFYGFRGHYANGKCYIHWDAFARNHTRLTEISEDLNPSSATHWWPKQASTPAQDDFASALLISLDQLVQVDMRYGTTEALEDDPPWALPTTGALNTSYIYRNGHTMWHKFESPVTGTVTVTMDATLSTIKTIESFSQSDRQLGLVVWTGSALGSLTAIEHYEPRSVSGNGTVALTFSATSGTTYYISTYAYAGSPPTVSDDMFGAAFDLDFNGFGITTIKLTA